MTALAILFALLSAALGVALACALARSRRLLNHIAKTSVDEAARLELHTAELAARNNDLLVLLDHVDQGFVTIDRRGRMGAERSAILEKWFGKPLGTREKLADFLGRIDADAGLWFELGFDMLISDVMPREVVLAELPSMLRHGGRNYRLGYTPIVDAEGEISSILFVVTDVTDMLAREHAEEGRRELHEAVEKALADRQGFLEFYEEGESMIRAITSGDLDDVEEKRVVHTLKGNSGLFGLHAFGRFCHELEARVSDSGEPLATRDREALASRWNSATSRLSTIFAVRRDHVEVDHAAFEALLRGIVSGAPRRVLAKQLRSWRLESFENRLGRCAAQARGLAERLGKPGLVVAIDGAGVKFEPPSWAPFWTSFVHILRNAIDHGIETPEERVRAGKSRHGMLSLEVSVDAQHLVLTVKDDGCGIDWERLRERARAAGLRAETRQHLVLALFEDGVSTASAISEMSGRGVGMATVRRACEPLGGRIEVESTRGNGTEFRFIFRRDTLASISVPSLDAPTIREYADAPLLAANDR